LLEPEHEEASQLMKMIEDAAEQLRNGAIILSLNGRLSDALNKISGAIAMNPSKAEYNLQRGILYKRLQNFNAAIDDFILGLDKIDHSVVNEPDLFKNLQRQILLTYNEFATQCFHKRFYDESIMLLNKAIRLEKNEKGLYMNRGGLLLVSL
jgi:tetratricopeptide (TPR) repeat protein